MCFEFEALYWAKLAEEEEKRKAAEQQRRAAADKPRDQPVYEEDPLPA
ncbi:MAG: hypothetical protein ABI648_12410 [Betaproteobacteria bacterium]|jgi:hypothetical protein